MKLATVQKVLGLSSADELDAAPPPRAPVARAGAIAPTSLAESLIHAASDAALDRLNAVLGVSGDIRDAFLTGPDGRALRNVLRRYVLHANAASMESET